MGQFEKEGKAIQVTWPGSEIINFGDLYRVDGWNGVALEDFTAAETPRVSAMEVACERHWYIKTAAGIGDGARGDFLYWTAGAGFKRGDNALTETPTGSPVCKIEEIRDAAGYVLVRLLNVGP